MHRNRPLNNHGVSHGGVVILYKETACQLKQLDIKNPEEFEILVASGSIRGHARKLVVFAIYLLPNYKKERADRALSYITDLVITMKRRFNDPYLVLAGDFNQWKIDTALDDFVDLKEVEVGETRGSRSIDRIFVNNCRAVLECETVDPLETEDENPARSDHRVAFVRMDLQRVEAFKWEEYSYRYFNNESV